MRHTPSIAVAHYPEGAGHATRMLAVADELEAAGANVSMAGGGAGTRFVALNGYDEFEPTTVDYIDSYQGGSFRRVLAESVPATAGRVTDYIEWLRATGPDALVTDDMFAAMAAIRTGTPLYALKHDMPGLYRDRVERAGARFHTGFQVGAARSFFYPAVWPDSGLAPEGVTRVPPVALEGTEEERGDADVVVVPSHYSELGRVADGLHREGYDVLDVGGDDWDAVPSLLPYLRAADVVVCSGYSTVMDAAVAGTPCVVHPATDEQAAVADRLERADVTGFAVATEPLAVLEAVASPPPAPTFENGAATVAGAVMDDLRERRPSPQATGANTADHAGGGGPPSGETAGFGPSGRVETVPSAAVTALRAASDRVGIAARGWTDRATAVAAALGAVLWAAALRGRRGALVAWRAMGRGAAAVGRRVGRARRRVAEAGRARLAALVARLRATRTGCRRYAVATVAVVAAALVFVRVGVRQTAGGLGGRLRAAARSTLSIPGACRRVGAAAVRRGADGTRSIRAGLARLGRDVRDAASSLP